MARDGHSSLAQGTRLPSVAVPQLAFSDLNSRYQHTASRATDADGKVCERRGRLIASELHHETCMK